MQASIYGHTLDTSCLFVLWLKASFIQFAGIKYSGNNIFKYLIFITKSDISCDVQGGVVQALKPFSQK